MMYDTASTKFDIPLIPAVDQNNNTPITRAHKQMVLPIKMTGLGLRSAVQTLDVAYIPASVRVAVEDKTWWSINAPTEDNNFQLVSQLWESIDNVKDKLQVKHKHLYPNIN